MEGIDRVLREVQDGGVELIRFLWVDHSGICRGKAVTRAALRERMMSGIGLAKIRQAANLFDEPQPEGGLDAVGEVRLIPDPSTFVLLPHAPGSAAMLCDLVEIDGTPWDACPRLFLRGAIASAAELGFELQAAFEPEFVLCASKPSLGELSVLDDSLCFDNEGFDVTNDFVVALVRALASQGIDVELYHPEFGRGQHELTIRHSPALRAADTHVWQRAMTRGLARQRGWWATFAPSPHPGFRGNGNHVHMSLWRDGRNAFADTSGGMGLSRTAHHFIGGLLAHAPALVALTCASVNSYRRLGPRQWSGGHLCHGPDNREAAVRIPSLLRGRELESANIEFKPCDATSNPYLALGALLLAGLDGVRRELDPGDPVTDDPNKLSEESRRRLGIRTLPGSLVDAIEALEADELLASALGPLRRTLYAAIKRSDARRIAELGEDEEFLIHAVRY